LVELSLLKLIADFDCIGEEELLLMARVFSDRYGLDGLDEGALRGVLELLQAKGLVVFEGGCYKLTLEGERVLDGVVVGLSRGG
jgi:hypothetical protein